MKKGLMLLLLACLVLPMAARAGPLQDVDGYFTYVPTGCEAERWANDNFIMRDCADVGDYYYGSFLGDSTEVYDFLMLGRNPDVPIPPADFEYGFYKGTVTFDGTVFGEAEGTMQILFVGFSPGDLFTWSGTWRILGGTGDLAGIHGQGEWGSSQDPDYPGVHYWGKIHSEP
jgi:hypothetical protein